MQRHPSTASAPPSASSEAHARIIARIGEHRAECLAVFERERHQRPHWPQEFERAIAAPCVAAVILLLATHAPAPRPCQHRAPFMAKRRYATRRQSELDFKSRAAGERDED